MTNTKTINHPQPDDNISRVFDVLMAARHENPTIVAEALGVPKSTIYSRRSSGGWRAAELADLADHFDVDPGLFYTDPMRVLRSVNTSGRSDAPFRTGSRSTVPRRYRVPTAA